MSIRKIEKTPSAHSFPLLIKNLLDTPLYYTPDREIIYRDISRYDYRTFVSRVAKRANALEELGIGQGDIVGVMDWDSHRYLESFFAIPCMGAVLHTINVRLSPEQLVYTINHAEDDVLLVNSEFLPLLESVKDQLQTVKKIVLLTDDDSNPDTSLSSVRDFTCCPFSSRISNLTRTGERPSARFSGWSSANRISLIEVSRDTEIVRSKRTLLKESLPRSRNSCSPESESFSPIQV